MKSLQQLTDNILTYPYSITYSIGTTYYTHYLQLLSSQLSLIVLICSYAVMKFKCKYTISLIDYFMSYHSLFLLLYAVFILNCSVLNLIDNIYLNWGILCGMAFVFIKGLFSSIIGFGYCVSNIQFASSSFVFWYSIGFFAFAFPIPIQYDLSYLHIGVLMLISTMLYCQLSQCIGQLMHYMAEKGNEGTEGIKFKVNMGDIGLHELMMVFDVMKEMVFGLFAIGVVMTTMTECLVFVRSGMLREVIVGCIESLMVIFVYWYYIGMTRVYYLINRGGDTKDIGHKDDNENDDNDKAIELSQAKTNTHEDKDADDDEYEGEDDEEEWEERNDSNEDPASNTQ